MMVANPKSQARPSARDRILAAASDLFYQEGIQHVGIDRIIAASGVAKMSLYNHFKSKDDLIATWLQEQEQTWSCWFHSKVEELATDPHDQLLTMFDVLKIWFDQPDFRGCAFINSSIELIDPFHPAYPIILEHQKATYTYIFNLVKAADLPNPEVVTQQLVILIEGAIIVAMTQHNSTSALYAKQAASILIDPPS